MKKDKGGKAHGRMKTHIKSQMRRSGSRQIDRLIDRLDAGMVPQHHHNRAIIDRVKPGPELVKVYSDTQPITPTKGNHPSMVKKESNIVKILIDVPARGDKKAGKVLVKIGFRVTMMDKSSWFYHFKFQTWTRTVGEKKESYGSTKSLLRTMGHCQSLCTVLMNELLAIQV